MSTKTTAALCDAPAITDLSFIERFRRNAFPYTFTLRSERGGSSTFGYPSFRAAKEASARNGNPRIFFTDDDGVEHLCASTWPPSDDLTTAGAAE